MFFDDLQSLRPDRTCGAKDSYLFFSFLLVSIFILSNSSYFVDKHIIADYHLYLITRHISSFIIDNLKKRCIFPDLPGDLYTKVRSAGAALY